MSIKTVTAHALSLPFDIGGPKPIFAGKERQMEMLLIRVETQDGLVGFGESFGFAIWPATVQALERLVAPLAIGQDESQITTLTQEIGRRLHPLGRAGPVTFAISGLDIALWDIAGQRQNKSLTGLLGGALRSRIPAYASLIRYNNPDLVAKNCAKAAAQGFKAIKIHEFSIDAIKAARQAIGKDIHLMVDANCPWDKTQALQACEVLRGENLFWLEEPLWPPEDHLGLAEIQTLGRIPTAAGENALGYMDFLDLIEKKSITYAQPSVTKIGGITEFIKVAQLIEDHALNLAPHSPYMGPGLIATAHLLATNSKDIFLEYTFCEMNENPLGPSILTQDGYFEVPMAPGLGIHIDMQIVEKLTVK